MFLSQQCQKQPSSGIVPEFSLAQSGLLRGQGILGSGGHVHGLGGRGRCLTGNITLLARVGAAWPLAHHGGHSSAKWTQRRL